MNDDWSTRSVRVRTPVRIAFGYVRADTGCADLRTRNNLAARAQSAAGLADSQDIGSRFVFIRIEE